MKKEVNHYHFIPKYIFVKILHIDDEKFYYSFSFMTNCNFKNEDKKYVQINNNFLIFMNSKNGYYYILKSISEEEYVILNLYIYQHNDDISTKNKFLCHKFDCANYIFYENYKEAN